MFKVVISILSFSLSGFVLCFGWTSSSRKSFQVPPLIAVITETNACDSVENVNKTLDTLSQILGKNNSQNVDLIVIRVIEDSNKNSNIHVRTTTFLEEEEEEVDDFYLRLVQLTKGVVQLKQQVYSQSQQPFHPFLVIVNDNLEAAIEANADGVHVKEHKVDSIPYIRSKFKFSPSSESNHHRIVIGTSTHNISSAVETWKLYQPDYFFVGTCYLTTSHPEKKNEDDLEGPFLPGKCKAAIGNHIRIIETTNITNTSIESSLSSSNDKVPIIFAIGGINTDNCHEPYCYGADGVAVIKSAMQASDPSSVISCMKHRMITKKQEYDSYTIGTTNE